MMMMNIDGDAMNTTTTTTAAVAMETDENRVNPPSMPVSHIGRTPTAVPIFLSPWCAGKGDTEHANDVFAKRNKVIRKALSRGTNGGSHHLPGFMQACANKGEFPIDTTTTTAARNHKNDTKAKHHITFGIMPIDLVVEDPVSPAVGSERRGFAAVRHLLFETCSAALRPYAIGVLENAQQISQLAPLSTVNQNAIAKRCCDQLSRWALCHEAPEDERRFRMRNVDIGGAIGERIHAKTIDDMNNMEHRRALATAIKKWRSSPKYANRRESDSQKLLLIQSGKAQGPAPATNTAYKEAVVSSGGESQWLLSDDELAMQDIVTYLMHALTSPPSESDAATSRRVTQVNDILRQFHTLGFSNEYVIVTVERKLSPVTRKTSANKIRRQLSVRREAYVVSTSEGQLFCDLGRRHPHQSAEDVALALDGWKKARIGERMSNGGLVPKSLRGRNPLDIGGELGELDMGYECVDRAQYFRSEHDAAYRNHDDTATTEGLGIVGDSTARPDARRLPPIARIPLSRAFQFGYMQDKGPTFELAACFRLIPDILMPTCPMVNVLLDGVMPYHMGSHAMLERYNMLLRAAIQRVCPDGLFPIAVGEMGDATPLRPAYPHTAVEMYAFVHEERRKAANALLAKVGACRDWSNMPDWCGTWFDPSAYMPAITPGADVDELYPERNLVHRSVVGASWQAWMLEQQSQGRNIRDQSFLDAAAEVVDRVGAECDRLENEKDASKPGTGEGREQDERYERLPLDKSRAGRAEFIMTLSLMGAFLDMLDSWEFRYESRVRKLREEDARQNGERSIVVRDMAIPIRSREYYVVLWEICIERTAELLEIHEIILLMLNSRWLDVNKIAPRVDVRAHRLATDKVKWHPRAVEIVMERRRNNQRRQSHIVDHLEEYRYSALRMHPWMADVIPYNGHRHDLPTYMDLALFEEFLRAIPTRDMIRGGQQQQDSAVIGSAMEEDAADDGGIAALVERTKALQVNLVNEHVVDPSRIQSYYNMPVAKRPPPAQKLSKKSERTESPTSDVAVGEHKRKQKRKH